MRYSIEVARSTTSSNVSFFPRLLLTALALSFLVSGLGLFIQHVTIMKTWPPVEATITRAEVIKFRDSRQRDVFRGEVELAYTVGEIDYLTPETFSHSSSSEDSIRRHLKNTYAVGSSHQVFYNPDNPHALHWAVGGNLAFFLLPVIFTSVGLVLMVPGWFLWRLPYPQRLDCTRCDNLGRPHERYCPRCGESLLSGTATAPSKEPRAMVQTALRRENPAAYLFVGVCFGLVGVVCSVGAAYLGVQTFVATRMWPIVEATVAHSAIETSRAKDGVPIYTLSVEFEFDGSQRAERGAGPALHTSGSYPWIAHRLARFTPGSRYKIRVNPHNSTDIRMDAENPLLNWLPPFGVGFLGFILVAIGSALTVSGLKPRCGSCRQSTTRGAAFCSTCGGTVGSDRSIS